MQSTSLVLLCFALALGATAAATHRLNNPPLEVAVQTSSNCSITDVEKTIETLYLDSYEFISRVLRVIFKIGVHFDGCPLRLEPVAVAECVFQGILQLPAEVGDILQYLAVYYEDVAPLVLQLVSDVTSCF